MISTLLALALAQPPPPPPSPPQAIVQARQGSSRDGGVAWPVECVNCSGGGVASSVSVSSGVVNVQIQDAGAPLNVQGTFWQGTQPVSIASMPSTPVTGPIGVNVLDAGAPLNVQGTFWQGTQTVSIASMPSTPVTGPISVNLLDAGAPLNVQGTFWQATQPVSGTVTCNAGSGTRAVSLASAPTTAVTGTFWQATQPVSGTVTANAGSGTFAVSGTVTANAGSGTMAVSGPLTDTQLRASAVPVSLANAPTTPITAAALPLPSGAATDSTLSQLLDGGVLALVRLGDGNTRPMAVDPFGAAVPAGMGPATALLQPCNPVRRTNCRR